MSWLWRFYDWFWYHSQALWIKSTWARKPYTLLFHDFAHASPVGYIFVQMAFVFGMWWLVDSYWIVLPILFGFIQGHILWGGHKVGEQEDPPYNPDEPEAKFRWMRSDKPIR